MMASFTPQPPMQQPAQIARWLSSEKLVYSPRIGEISSLGTGQKWLAFTASRYDTHRKVVSDLFLHNAESFNTVQLTRNKPGTSVSCPTLASMFHPDGDVDHVFFLRSGKIWAIPLEGGEAYVVWEESLPINSFHVEGPMQQKFIVAEFSVPAGAVDPFAPEAPVEGKGKGKLFSNLMVRYWTEWNAFEKRNHIFMGYLTVNPEGCITVEHPVVDMMHGMETDCPPKSPNGHGRHDYVVAPNSRWVAMAARSVLPDRTQPSDYAWTTDLPIFMASLKEVDLTLAPSHERYRALTWTQISDPALRSYQGQPVFSPDSEKVAYLSMTQAKYESDRNRIVVYHLGTQQRYCITEDVDISFQSLLWSEEGNVLYGVAQHKGCNRVFRICLDEACTKYSSIDVLQGDESRSSLQVLRTEEGDFHLYFLESTLLVPNVLKRLDLRKPGKFFAPFDSLFPASVEDAPIVMLDVLDGSMQIIYDVNPEFTNGDLLLPEASQHYFRGANGDLVHCWYLAPLLLGDDKDRENVTPLEPTGERTVPLLVVVHGGPQGAMLNSWNYRWNLAAFASQGYAVVAINFHGSTGFGTAFQDSIRKDWGGKPFDDIMLGVDFVLQKYPYINPDRMAALGASYGGYMMNWINGHSDRFKCLVNHAGIFSLRSEYCTTEELFFPEWDLGVPWVESELFQRWSPDSFVGNWKTPTFVIHGGKDFRVPETEGISTYTALQRRGIASQFLYFADEGHWVLQAHNSMQWNCEVIGWLKKWLMD